MSDMFVDTSGWGELIDSSLMYHSFAANIYRQTRQQKRQFITTNYIITEPVTLLTNPLRVMVKSQCDVIELAPDLTLDGYLSTKTGQTGNNLLVGHTNTLTQTSQSKSIMHILGTKPVYLLWLFTPADNFSCTMVTRGKKSLFIL